MKRQEGRILRGVGGFYYVETADAVYECRARGLFRKEGITPLAGDRAVIAVEADNTGFLEEILPRRNALVRPPIANVDMLAIVCSVADPQPNTLVMDKLIATAEQQCIEPILLINKTDLGSPEEIAAIYRKAGFAVFTVCAKTGEGLAAVRECLKGKVTAFTGNSGVGKSSLLNVLEPDLMLDTGETSKKLGRGRHTTRVASLYPVGDHTYFVDTPGFSSLIPERVRLMDREQLAYWFREFEPYVLRCRYAPSCSHVKEAGCAVREAVERGDIAPSRYESYVRLYEEMKEYKAWQTKS